MECLMCGATQTSSKCYFLLKDGNGLKYLYEASSATLQTTGRSLVDASSKFGQATHYATNVKTADYLYYVYDNNLTTHDEGTSPLSLQGLDSGEEIVYLSYQWLSDVSDDEDFTYLMVGTQEGETYRLRMYDIAGGEPRALVRTLEGKGKIKTIAYITPRYNKMEDWTTGTPASTCSYPN